jgi:hypothetical protein
MSDPDILILAGKEYHHERKYARDRHSSRRSIARKRANGCPYLEFCNEIWLNPTDADSFILKEGLRRHSPPRRARRQSHHQNQEATA